MIALLAAAVLTLTSAPAAAPAAAPPPAAEANVTVQTEPFVRPRPKILGVPDDKAAQDLIAAATPLLRERPTVAKAFLILVDYGEQGGKNRTLVIDGPRDDAFAGRIVTAFTRRSGGNTTVDVVFLPASEIAYVAANAAPFYVRTI